MRCTPVVIGLLILRSLNFHWKVMEQPSFCGCRCLDYMLEVAGFVFWDLLFSIFVTCSSHENRSVDDETTEILESVLEAGNSRVRRPDVRAKILREVLGRELRCRFGTRERGVNVESTICVKGAFIGVDLAISECLLAAGPAG